MSGNISNPSLEKEKLPRMTINTVIIKIVTRRLTANYANLIRLSRLLIYLKFIAFFQT